MSSNGSKRVIFVALVGNSLISITKFIGAAVTGSSAMASEGIHSLVDTGNQLLLLLGLKRAARPADDDFPFGYGKEIYFWSFVVAILIFALGAGISMYKGVVHILHPTPMRNIYINYIILGLSIIFEGGACLFAFKEFKKHKGDMGYIEAVRKGKDPALFVVLFEDIAAILGLIIAFVGVMLGDLTGILIFDGIASILIGVILALTALFMAIETKGLLIGESASKFVIREVRDILSKVDHIDNINEVLTMHMGPEYVLLNIGVDFNDHITADEVERIIHNTKERIKINIPNVKKIYIEAKKKNK